MTVDLTGAAMLQVLAEGELLLRLWGWNPDCYLQVFELVRRLTSALGLLFNSSRLHINRIDDDVDLRDHSLFDPLPDVL